MYKHRQIESTIKDITKSFKVVLVTGARQVGKTYIIKEFGNRYYENVVYVNFEKNKQISNQINDDINPLEIINKLELFFNEKTVREYARIRGIPFTTIQSRKDKIIEKLRKILKF